MTYSRTIGYPGTPKTVLIKKAPKLAIGRAYNRETPFSALFNSIYDGAIITDDKGWIQDVNYQAQQLFAYPAEELKQLNITNIIAGTNEAMLGEICRNIDAEKHTLLEGKCVRGDKSSFMAEIAVGIERMPPSNGPCFFVRDISQRRETQNYLLTLKRAFENAATGILVTDLEGIILFSNQRFTQLMGIASAANVTSHHVHSLFSDEEVFNEIMQRVVADQAHERDLSLLDANGAPLYLRINGTLNCDASDHATGMVFLVEDITQQKENAAMKEEAARKALEMAEANARLQTIATLGYEFNNPLQSLLSMAEKDQRPEYKSEISRLINIVQQLHLGKDFEKIIGSDGSVRYQLDLPARNLEPCAPGTILVGEDERMIRDLFVQFLQFSFEDARIDQAADGRQVLSKFYCGHHNIIMLDSMMPLLEGEQVYDLIVDHCKKHTWAMPHIIFCTGFVPSEKIKRIIGDGTQHALLPKPVRQSELVDVVKKFFFPPDDPNT